MPKFTEHKAIQISNTIMDKLEEDYQDLNNWEKGFLEDIQNKVTKNLFLTQKQYDKLLDLIGTNWL